MIEMNPVKLHENHYCLPGQVDPDNNLIIDELIK